MDLGAIAAFVSAAEGGNFTAAATALGISASGVSKAVSRLENELHVRLFNRSTRSLSLTADGVVLYQRCKQILIDLNDAKLAMSHAQDVPKGRLYVSIPAAFGRSHMIPAISAFMRHYPLIEVDASVTDRFVDMVEEGFDAVVRIGDLPDTRMIARSLGVTRFVVAASPHYFQRQPRPEKPEDLRDHNCVSFISPQTKRITEWVFFSNDKKIVHTPAGTLSLDDGEAMVDAAINHSGIIYCQDYMIENAVKDGKLQRVLKDFITPEKPVVVMYPQNRHLSLKVRVFVDFMVNHFS
ncbi:LysR family transcriptional regulator for bpeEF and oprC [Erwinia persicina]|jgi:LysR family transcriptional regulator for bpeEF and oprC|uniref:LysR family transcriptional regulator n=1 Tax=Erwinia plantamica TaxID=3237104 RepID=A0ABW7CT95_9GAMM|nr:LysR family transcriptional regulator [Erwinia persicina]MCP1437087.1 LysR family transcriptional regulator for bpeEF and oprC [Erwinia persicina]